MGSQLKIGELISAIRDDQLILPEFQRGFVWNREKVKDYLQSLYRGYPTGSFLLWKTPRPGLVRGGVQVSDGGHFQLILDGQQRLTSIYTLVEGKPPPFYEGDDLFFNLYFNVKSEVFQYYKPSEMKGLPEWLPVTPFLKAGLGQYLKNDGPLKQETREFLLQFFDQLSRLDQVKQYTYYLDILGEKEMEEVVTIFNLVNSKGTPLSKADLALSHICALWPEARQEMRAAQEVFRQADFDFELNFLVRCTASVATNSGYFEPLYRVDIDEIRRAWLSAKKALEYLINVLKQYAYMNSSGSVTSLNALVPLVVHLANNGFKFADARDRKNYLHWMYAALMWGRYSGIAETKLNQDLAALKTSEPAKVLRANILAERGRIKVEGRDLIGASWRTAWSSMAYVVAQKAGAVDWFNGLTVNQKLVGKSNVVEYHHIFPQALLYDGPYSGKSRADVQKVNEVANIAFVTSGSNKHVGKKSPSKYLPAVLAHYPQSLKQQCVPEQTALWETNRFEEFLAARRERLAKAINAYMDSLITEEPNQAFTVKDYIAMGEGETVEFKQSLRWDFKLGAQNKVLEKMVAKTIAAFMNSKGGTLMVGVSDEGDVVGLEADLKTLSGGDIDTWEQHLRNVLNAFLSKETCALVEASFPEVDQKLVAVLRAERQLRPVYLTDTGAEFYIRSGNTTQQLGVKQAVEYIKEHFPPTG